MASTIQSYKSAIEEAKFAFNEQMESIKSIKDTAKTILQSTSIIVSVVGSLQAIRTTQPSNVSFYNWVVIFAAVAFIFLIYFCIRVLLPIELFIPIKSDWEEYSKYLLDKSEEDVLSTLIATYLSVIDKNKPILTKASYLATWAGVFMCLVVLGMMTLILIR